jgi:hypothetical protein
MRPIIIGVGGARSGSGKTIFASLLLRRFPRWGAIKYTKTPLYCSIVDDPYTLMEDGKDTRRMMDAGAERVLWVLSPPSEIGDVLPVAVERLSDLKGIVVEGNSAIEFLSPDIIIFIFGNDASKIKSGAREILYKADVIVFEGDLPSDLSGGAKVFGRSAAECKAFLEYIAEMVQVKEKIRSSLKEKAVQGKIPCQLARKIAEELNVQFRQVGKVADELDIKITNCELGCF